MTASARHATRALLRAHLAAASTYGHLTAHCPVCRHLLRLAMDGAPTTAADAPEGPDGPEARERRLEALQALQDEQPADDVGAAT
ncbi:DUF6274 family protein [Streptomyces mexicanus]|uniref:Uncharacterized protein n=1 Tax=Streptomyces mexicanus TaxID=178566 RepID=A0A7X1I180_9ACTN|nr:DUF6274 family protein [Streptomyces mexicanus]MBC2865758.1 hypothetical protein [Streptomyces mexicanus]